MLFTANTFSKEIIEELKAKGIEIIPQRGDLSESELIDALKDVDAYIAGGDEIATQKVINSTNKLKIITFLGAGYERYIDVKAARAKNIVVTNTPAANAHTVAEHSVALILDAVKQITALNNETKKGGWNKRVTWNLKDKVLGIVGMGAIGSIVARILHNGFGMKVVYFSRTSKPEIEQELKAQKLPLIELFKKSDVVSLHISYSEKTIGLVGEKELNSMKANSILVNASRAEIVKPQALYQALIANKLATAAFDVYYKEPVPKPEEDEYKLLTLPDNKFIVTPHTAYNSSDAVQAMEEMVLRSITDFFAGREVSYRVN